MNVLAKRKIRQIEDRIKAGIAWEAWEGSKGQDNAAVFTNALGQHLAPKTLYRPCIRAHETGQRNQDAELHQWPKTGIMIPRRIYARRGIISRSNL